MRVRVDPSKCEGYGACVGYSPAVFELDEWGYAFVRGDGEVPPGEEDAVRAAIVECPVKAIAET